MKLKHWLSVSGSAFVSGAAAWASMHIATADVSTIKGIEGFALSAVLGGLIAVLHLYQPKPSAPTGETK